MDDLMYFDIEEDDGMVVGEVDEFTALDKKNLDKNTAARHIHENKDVLDGITEDRVKEWDNNKTDIDTLSKEKADILKLTTDTTKTHSLNDSAEFNIVGLNMYGETTQDGTPTPNNPVDIVSVENPTINFYGKNLDTAEHFFSTFPHFETVVEDGRNCVMYEDNRGVNNPFKFQKNTQYTFSFYAKKQKKPGAAEPQYKIFRLFDIYYTDGTRTIQSVSGDDDVWKKIVITSSANKSIDYVRCESYQNAYYGFIDVDTFQIEIGDTATEYEPYKDVQSVEIPYTFATGDYLELKNNLLKININGNETDITDTEAGQALLNLYTNYPNTTITCDADCNITYKADTTNAYNNLKNTLTQAIIALGGTI